MTLNVWNFLNGGVFSNSPAKRSQSVAVWQEDLPRPLHTKATHLVFHLRPCCLVFSVRWWVGEWVGGFVCLVGWLVATLVQTGPPFDHWAELGGFNAAFARAWGKLEGLDITSAEKFDSNAPRRKLRPRWSSRTWRIQALFPKKHLPPPLAISSIKWVRLTSLDHFCCIVRLGSGHPKL